MSDFDIYLHIQRLTTHDLAAWLWLTEHCSLFASPAQYCDYGKQLLGMRMDEADADSIYDSEYEIVREFGEPMDDGEEVVKRTLGIRVTRK